MADGLFDTHANKDYFPFESYYAANQMEWRLLEKYRTEGLERISLRRYVAPCPSCQSAQHNAFSNAARFAEKLRHALPPPPSARFTGCSWETYPSRDPGKSSAFDICQSFLRDGECNGKRGLLLHGEPSVGKTGLLWLLYKQAQGAAWVDYNDLMSHIQSNYGKPGSDTRQTLEALQCAPALFLDDMGDVARTRPISDDRRDKTYEILRARHQANLPTFITSNLTPHSIALQFGARIAERIAELCLMVQVSGEKLR
ncbi:hypothetical protein FBQ95_16935 [Chloroflexi bacterium CFX3]|nr:hypothetical protein [Chloroflexi bacterium CFX3]